MMEPRTPALNPFQPDSESLMWADVPIDSARWACRYTWPCIWWSNRDEEQMILLSFTMFLHNHADPPSQIHYFCGSETSPSFVEFVYSVSESASHVLSDHLETADAISDDSLEL